MADCRIEELEAQTTVAVRVKMPMSEADMGKLFSTYLPLIFARLETGVGPPYGRYHEWGPENIDVEIGVPVVKHPELSPLDEVAAGQLGLSELPGGKTATTIHFGSYETLSRSYDLLHEWMLGQGQSPASGPWESYLDDPGQVEEVSQVRTAVFWPLA